MTRLDQIERKAQFLSERRECKVWHFEIADVAALVAVARAAAGVIHGADTYGDRGSVTHVPLRRALAPLLAERGEPSAGASRAND